jgi:hypothetical protein
MSTDTKLAPSTQKWLDCMAAKPPPNRFWDHLSFCATLFWALRKEKHMRAGQLIVNVLRKKTAFHDHLGSILFNQEDDQLSTLIEEYVNDRK